MAQDYPLIMKVLVGSRAHGLAEAASDADYRGVFVIPTAEFFRLGFKYQATRWIEGPEDATYWEIGELLSLATHGHPLVLEALLAPAIEMDDWGRELRALFPALWAPAAVHEAFVSYAVNQRKKFLDQKDDRPAKYASAYIRVLANLCELLATGTFTVQVADGPIKEILLAIKAGKLTTGQIIDAGEHLREEAAGRLAQARHQPDLEAVNAYLGRLRRAFLA